MSTVRLRAPSWQLRVALLPGIKERLLIADLLLSAGTCPVASLGSQCAAGALPPAELNQSRRQPAALLIQDCSESQGRSNPRAWQETRGCGETGAIPDDRKTLDPLGRKGYSPVSYLQPPLLVASSE